MTSVSLSLNRGLYSQKPSDLTVGTLATNAGDIELRVNLTDAQGKNLTDKDIVLALEVFRRYFTSGSNVGGATSPIL